MANEREIFTLSGPRHLTNIDWSDTDHRRCVAASLVEGIFVQERDRQERRHGPDAHAEMWWSFFNFKLLRPLRDDVDGSIFGAVYKWNEKAAGGRSRPPGAPKIVVAFRGTVIKWATFGRDLRLNLRLLANRLHTTSRFHAAFDPVKTTVEHHGADNVWVAGHSLGAAIAMLAGRKMAEEKGRLIEAHLFNPPFVSAPVESIKNQKLKRGLLLMMDLIRAALAMTLQRNHAQIESGRNFSVLQWWVPCLYVNPRDDLCSGYVGYFDKQMAMQQIGATAGQHSMRMLAFSAVGKESKAGHLIPSARLIVSRDPASDFKRAHGIYQWWAPDIRIESTEYRLVTEQQTPAGPLFVGQIERPGISNITVPVNSQFVDGN